MSIDEVKDDAVIESVKPPDLNKLSPATQWARWRAAKKNRLAQTAGLTDAFGNTIRPPLDSPENALD